MEQQQQIYHFGRFWNPPFTPSQLSTFYADDVYLALGFGLLTGPEAETIGKAVLHTAMNACLKHSKGGGQDGA
jgi:hypothetical protein